MKFHHIKLLLIQIPFCYILVKSIFVQKLPQQTLSNVNCSSSNRFLQLQQPFITKDFTVRFQEDCLLNCFSLNTAEVIEIIYGTDLNGIQMNCHCSNVLSRYLLVFPLRYTTCVVSDAIYGGVQSVDIFYLPDRSWQNLTNILKPLLFYPLDDISTTMNIGTLGKWKYSLKWMEGKGSFNCSKNNQQRKWLTLNPADNPVLGTIHDLTMTETMEVTWMIWSKKRVPSSYSMPIFQGMSGSGDGNVWQIWNDPNFNGIMFSFVNAGNQKSNVIDANSWNNVEVTSKGNVVTGIANLTSFASFSMNPSSWNFGDRFYIGYRLYQGNRATWDGCLAHAMIFNRSLTREEMQVYMDLMNDDLF